MKALVVLSGGQDSTTCLFWAVKEYGRANVAAITFDYGQRHAAELRAADRVAAMAGVLNHQHVNVSGIMRSVSPLVDQSEQLETYSSFQEMEEIIGNRIEKTFVPMRNALFLTIAANRAVALGCDILITGVCQQDNANYPDCTIGFIESQEETINTALGRHDFHIVTPLMNLSKAQSIVLASTLQGCMDALAYSHTAYDGQYPPTSKDHASMLRAQGFLEAGVPDPLVLRAVGEGLMELPGTSNYAAVSPL